MNYIIFSLHTVLSLAYLGAPEDEAMIELNGLLGMESLSESYSLFYLKTLFRQQELVSMSKTFFFVINVKTK